MEIRISSKKIAMKLVGGIVVLLIVHLFFQTLEFAFGHDYVLGLAPLFDLDKEHNIPTIYTFFLLAIAAKLLGTIAYDALTSRKQFGYYWAGLSVVFAWLALDELLAVHERWIDPLRDFFQTSGYLYFIWQLPYFILLIILGLIYVPFWKKLPGATRRLFLMAAFLYLAATIVFESLSGMYLSAGGGDHDAFFTLLATIEETLEMTGVVVFIYALLEYARQEIRHISLEWITE